MSKDLSDKLYIYSPIVTERLVYVADFLSRALALKVEITDNPSVLEKDDIYVINYSGRKLSKNEVLNIQPSGLLFEKGVITSPPGSAYGDLAGAKGHRIVSKCFRMRI